MEFIRKKFIPEEIKDAGIEIEKFNLSYILPRKDILDLIKIKQYPKRILDIGCSVGTLGIEIKKKYKGVLVYGIEYDEKMAEYAKKFLDKVICGDIEEIDLLKNFEKEYFDVIIFADLLEHLKNPWEVLKKSKYILKKDGIVIASIPNVRHYSTIVSLVFFNYWPYRNRGINDKTHLRFFTIRNIYKMFKDAGFKIIYLKRKYRIIESPNILNIFSRLFVLPGFEDFLTFQYLVVAQKINES